MQFFVRWKNYPPDQNTWETFDFFAFDAPDISQKYITKVFKAFKVPRVIESLKCLPVPGTIEVENVNGGGLSTSDSNQPPVTSSSHKTTSVGGVSKKLKDSLDGFQGLTQETKIRIISQL